MKSRIVGMPSTAVILFAAIVLLFGLGSTASAFHLFRGNEAGGCSPDGGNFTQPECCPATGQVSDDPTIPNTNTHISGPIGATVLVLHNSFNTELSAPTNPPLLPGIVVIKAGQSVEWKWASYHCHSVTGGLPASDPGSPLPVPGPDPGGKFDSGFLYPASTPGPTDMDGLAATMGVKGFLDYPFPDFETQTLSFVHTFNVPGDYVYHCVHHQEVGMEGVVIVQ